VEPPVTHRLEALLESALDANARADSAGRITLVSFSLVDELRRRASS